MLEKNRYKASSNNLRMKYLLVIPLMLLLAWQKQNSDQITVDAIKADQSFIHYMELVKAHQRAIISDDWSLRSEKVKSKMEEAKKNKTTVELYKRLKNAKGISYYTATNELMNNYIKLAIKYSLKDEVNKKMFNEATKQYYSEHK
jgi:parvulin-like peptidyl-prolyl isomerase